MKDQELQRQVEREHGAVREAVEDLRGELSRLEAEAGPDHRTGRLCGMLYMFRHHLRRHFRLEEEGGLLVERARIDPGTRRKVRRLRDEHAELEERLESLIQGVEPVDAGRACLPDSFVRSLEGFLAALAAHEQAENDLVQEIVYRDVGVGD